MDDMKLSGNQIFWMIATMQTGMAILLTIGPAIHAASQNGWISVLIATVITIFVIFCTIKLGILYPESTLVQYSPFILGRWLGNFVVFVFLIYFYMVFAIILQQYSTAVIGMLLPHTPRYVPVAGMMLVNIYVCVSGVSVIGRCSEILGPIVLAVLILTLVLSIHGMHFLNLLPVYPDSGWLALLQGALPPAGFLGDSVLLVMLVAFMKQPRQALKPAIWAGAVAGVITAITALDAIATFGPHLSGSMIYPYFLVVRNISIADFIQNIDSLFISVWIVSVFTKCSIYLFASSYGTAQWLGIKNWKRVVWFVAPAVTILALLPVNFVQTSILFPKKIVEPFILPINIVGLPLLLYLVGSIRHRKAKP